MRLRARMRECGCILARARVCVSVGVFLRARVCVCVCLSAFVRACVRAFMHTARRRLTSSWSCSQWLPQALHDVASIALRSEVE